MSRLPRGMHEDGEGFPVGQHSTPTTEQQYSAAVKPRNIYCYRPQASAVLELLRPFVEPLVVKLVPIDERNMDKLRGLEGVTFVMVTHHHDRIPQQIHQALLACGCIIWHLDDSNKHR